MRPFFARIALLLCLGIGLGCAARQPAPVTPAAPPDGAAVLPGDDAANCDLTPLPIGPGESIASVALTDPVDPANAPYPANDSERLLFRQLYEALIRVDCSGVARPALAASWRLDADGETWLVSLRQDARFADGAPVSARDVLSAWSADGAFPGGASLQLRPQVLRLIRSAAAVDDHTLAIALQTPHAGSPLPLAHADLAVVKRTPDSVWAVGTRAVTMTANASALILDDAAGSGAAVRFLLASGRDPRDLLDEGVDLLVTRDPQVLEYAATLPQFAPTPLPWQRTHVLLAPGRTAAAPGISAAARESLAQDAVRGEARGAQGPFWWQSPAGCEISWRPQAPAASFTGRIVYDARDGVARDLAERLVGLVSAGDSSAAAILDALLSNRSRRTDIRAAGLTGEALQSARQRGDDEGYILELDYRPLDPCRDLQIVVETARWLDPAAIVPLVDTRLQAIVRRGRSGAAMEWDGSLLLTGGRN